MAYGNKRKAPFSAPPAKRRRTVRPGLRSKAAPYTKRVPVRPRTATRINKSRISALESKINGHVQRGYHSIKIRNDPNNPTAFNWQPNKPLLFALNDFYTQTTAPNGGTGAVMYPIYSGASPNLTMNAAILDRWQDYLPGQSLGHSSEYNQWKDQKLSQPSKVGYQPLYTDIRVNVNRRECSPAQGDMWIRVDVFKPKKVFLATTGIVDPKEFNMPTALGALSNVACGDNNQKNSFNPALWTHVHKPRWFKLPAVEVATGQIQTNFHIRCSFPKKFLPINLDVTTDGVGEPFFQAVDPRSIYWCMLSISNFSANQSSDPTPEITMTRKIVYRDSRGAQM